MGAVAERKTTTAAGASASAVGFYGRRHGVGDRDVDPRSTKPLIDRGNGASAGTRGGVERVSACRYSVGGGNLGRVQQSLRRKVRVSLRHPGRGVPEQPLHHVERDASVHEQARKRVAKVMQADVRQSCASSDSVPRVEDADEAGWEDVGAGGVARDRLQHRQRRRVKGNCPGLARFRDGYPQHTLRPVHVLPLGPRDLVAARAGEQQQGDGLCGGSVFVLGKGRDEAVGFLRGQNR